MISSTLVVLLVAALGAKANPVPQGVTALIAPPAPAPSGCAPSYSGLFAIAAVKAEGVPIPSTLSNKRNIKGRALSQQPDGQVTGSFIQPVSQIGDAQPQAPTITPVSQIGDAQPQAPTYSSTMYHTAISQIGDGQVQIIYTTIPVVTQIGDAQPQAPTATVVSQIGDAQPQAPKTTAAVSQIGDAQPQASTLKTSTLAATSTGSGAAPSVSMVACKTNSTLELDLQNGQLKDGKGRFGYIASNFQFQFDAGVPQAGAIYTSGFSVCDNGTLALGGSTIFWQCLSGTFYNLYDRYWAPQCSPVNLRVVGLKDC